MVGLIVVGIRCQGKPALIYVQFESRKSLLNFVEYYIEEESWIATYIPFSTSLLYCHVNVDVTSTVNIFLYLYK